MKRSVIRILRIDGAVLMLAGSLLAFTGHYDLGRYPLWLAVGLLMVATFLDFYPPR